MSHARAKRNVSCSKIENNIISVLYINNRDYIKLKRKSTFYNEIIFIGRDSKAPKKNHAGSISAGDPVLRKKTSRGSI